VVITIAGLYLALTQLTGALSRVLWGVMSDRFMGGSRLPALLLAASTGAAGSLLLALVPTDSPLPLVAVGAVTCAAGAIGWNGIWTSLLSELARPGSEGATVGLGLTLIQPGQLAGPFIFGLIVDATGSFRLAWVMLSAMLALAAVAIFVVSGPRKPIHFL
jgi:MFS family permease